MNIFSYLLTFIEGILTFISPCVLPMLPIYFVYLAGSEKSEITNQQSNRLIVNSVGFVIGFTIVFVLLGATVTSVGRYLYSHKDILRQISGGIMILFGLHFTGILNIKLLNIEKRIDFKFEKLSFLSSIVFGMVFGFGWTPCLGAFLGSALALASNSNTILHGAVLLFIYSIGLGIPFIISAILFNRVKGTFKKIQKYNRLISTISGLVLIIAGVLVFFDILKYLGNYF